MTPRCDTTFTHFSAHALPSCRAFPLMHHSASMFLSLSPSCITLTHTLSLSLDARHALGSASCLPRVHDAILHLFNTARSCLPCMLLAYCYIYSTHFQKGMLLRASSPVRAMLLLQWFCSRSCFCFFLTFFCCFHI